MKKAEVRLADQVKEFLAALAPDARKKLRAGLRGLATDRGDIKDLVDELSGYRRLRVGRFRVIYQEGFKEGRPVRECLYANRRNIVYELFAQMILDDVRSPAPGIAGSKR